MKPARLILLAVAIGAAGLAGYMALQLVNRPTPDSAPVIQVAQVPSVEVLVAREGLPVGTRLNASSVSWAPWPENGVRTGFVIRNERPEALSDLDGAIVRLPIFQGEPIRSEKIVGSSNTTMSALLPAGKRAVSTRISVETGAGGFILPNDRVDVIMVRRDDDGNYLTDTVLSNIRVLAIDQRIQEGEDEENATTLVGGTATLELTPEQAQIMAVAQQIADGLTLALRSVIDAREPDDGGARYLLSGQEGGTIQVFRSGTVSTIAGSN